MELNRHYANLYREIVAYNRPIRRFLSILFFTYVQIISFITYLLFMTQQQIGYKLLYLLIYLAHLELITLMIVAGAQIAGVNYRFGKRLQRFHYLSDLVSMFGFGTRIKVSVEQNH